MNNDKKEFLIAKCKDRYKFLKETGYNVLAVMLYGSQNYDLDTIDSDIDVKAILLPSLDDMIQNKSPISTNIEYENGLIELKDIREFYKTIKKGNPAYLEVLVSDYRYGEGELYKTFEETFCKKNLIDTYVQAIADRFYNACYGMMLQKQKALTHPYPSIQHKIDQYGFDSKQLHHMIRLFNIILETYYNFEYSEVIVANYFAKELMMQIKDMSYFNKSYEENIQDAKEMAKMYISRAELYRPEYSSKETASIIEKTLYNTMNKIIKRNILSSIN